MRGEASSRSQKASAGGVAVHYEVYGEAIHSGMSLSPGDHPVSTIVTEGTKLVLNNLSECCVITTTKD